MLLELSVDNIVIVSRARLEVGAGLTVISGETGAGKTLLLDALGLLLGSRSSPDCLGPDGDEALVSGVFAVDGDLRRELADELGLRLEGDELVLRRRLRRSGRGRAWIDDQAVSVSGLRACGDRLVEFRLQNEALHLADPAYQLSLLDRYGGHGDLAAAYREAHAACLSREGELACIEEGERDSIRELTHLRFLEEEFAALDPHPGELAKLTERQELLAGAREWQALAAEAVDGLIEGDAAVLPWTDRLRRRLAEAPAASLRQAADCLEQAVAGLQEAGRLAAEAGEEITCDEGELAGVEERLGRWHELLRKHGGTERSLLAARDAVVERIGELEGLGERRAACTAALAEARRTRTRAGKRLAAVRRRAAADLGAAAIAGLADLGLDGAELSLHEDPDRPPGHDAFIHQELWIRTNPGLPPGPLGAVPSGGEVSRLSLALTCVLAGCERVGTLIFDEVDSGVGGRLAGAIAEKLHALAADRAVVAITHSPQIAARADRHYLVSKCQTAERTTVSVRALRAEARRREIAEMLGGGDHALHQAAALLGEGQ